MEESSRWKRIEKVFEKFSLIMEIPPPQYPLFPFIPLVAKQALIGFLYGLVQSICSRTMINPSTNTASCCFPIPLPFYDLPSSACAARKLVANAI
jgi:hypothetical protein